MNLQQLSTFCSVLTEGSMTAAAEKLFLTQPAVSQQIRALEEELQTPLLVRGTRQIKPTIQGQLLYDYAKKILHLTHQAEVAIQTISQEIAGNLRIGTTNSYGLYLISPIVGLFLKHNTQLRIKLTYSSAEGIIQKMKANKIDIAVLPHLKTEFGIQFDNYEERFLMEDEMWLVGSGKDTTLPPSIHIKEITSRPLISHASFYPQFSKLFHQELERHHLEFKPVFESDNTGTLKRVIESGLGWGFMPSHSIKKQVRMRRLTHIQVDGLVYKTKVNIYSRKAEGLKEMTDVFFRAMQQQSLNY